MLLILIKIFENDYTEDVVSVISKLYLNIIKIYNELIENEKNIIIQSQLNFDLCEIIIKYTFVFSHPAFSKFFFDTIKPKDMTICWTEI